jgi:hypothetical protein
MSITGRILVATLFAVAGTTVFAQAPADLAKAAHDRDQAVDKADSATWDRLTADDFTVVNESGRLLTRAERLAEIRKSKPSAPAPCLQEQFKVYGDTAVRRCVTADLSWLEVWVKSAQGWRAAAVQGTKSAPK